MPFEFYDVERDALAMKRMLQFTKGKREVSAAVENVRVTLGYDGGS